MAEFKIKVSTENDSTGTKAAQQDISKLKKEVEGLGDAAKQSDGEAAKLGGLAAFAQRLAGRLTAAAAAFAVLRKSVQAYAETETDVAKMNAALHTQGLLTREISDNIQK